MAPLPLRVLTTLPNGLRIATTEMPHMASVSIGLWVGVGGRHEPTRLNGVSHFLEHLLFKGTRHRTAAEISQAVEGIGGYLNAFTDEEHTCFYARAQAERLPELVEVLLDMYLGSLLDPTEIRRERGVIREEISMYLDQPGEHVQDLLNAAQFGEHPLGRPVIGTEQTVTQMRRADIVGYLNTRYVTGSTVIAAAGNLRHADLLRLVQGHASKFRGGIQPTFVPAPPVGPAPRVKLCQKATEQTHASLAIRTVARTDERRFTLRLLNVVLGENMSSRLFQVIREEHGLAYNIHSATTFWADAGDIVISAGLEHDELEPALKLILKELRRLTERPVGRAEFGRARDYILGQLDLSLEGTENQMMALGEQVIGFGTPLNPENIRQALRAVTPRQIQACARDFFRPERLSFAAIGPSADSVRLEKMLIKSR